MTSEQERTLITCAPESEAFALSEMRALAPDAPPPVWLSEGCALFAPGVPFDVFAMWVSQQRPLFFRHLAPVQKEVLLRADETDITTLSEAALTLIPRLRREKTFAVQSRILVEGAQPYRRFTLNSALSEALQEATGSVMDCRAPEQALSVLCTPTTGYLGISRTQQNLSAWAGGEHRFQKEEGQISRAEFKLLEALAVFHLHLPTSGVALDMGAAPGGWTRVLRQRGLRVIAVDPADLDGRLRRDTGVVHIRKKIEEYRPGTQQFAVLLNDLRMDALDSVEVMLRLRDNLRPDGLGLMTLKLPQNPAPQHDTLATVHLALDRLTRGYTLLGARQLYHNRSEVTVALRPH